MQDMDPRLSPPGGPVSGGEMTIFEGHLEKISDILSVRLHAIKLMLTHACSAV